MCKFEYNSRTKTNIYVNVFYMNLIIFQSQVMEWGDLSFSTEPVGDFIGNCANQTKNLKKIPQVVSDVPKTRVIDSRDVKLVYLQK